jgi:hypothetical protein
MKAVVKSKHPFLSAKHHKARLDFAHAHKDWTVDDWRRVVWSDETKINCYVPCLILVLRAHLCFPFIASFLICTYQTALPLIPD